MDQWLLKPVVEVIVPPRNVAQRYYVVSWDDVKPVSWRQMFHVLVEKTSLLKWMWVCSTDRLSVSACDRIGKTTFVVLEIGCARW